MQIFVDTFYFYITFKHVPTMRTYVYRVYPSPAQQQRLMRWEGACRFLWNIAHEQRLLGLIRPRGAKVYPTVFDQARELTELRAEHPWLADVPRHASQAILNRLGECWDRFLAKDGGRPQFKKRSEPPSSIEEFEANACAIKQSKSVLRFPKLGNLPIVLHRPLQGNPKLWQLVRDVDQWFAHIVCELPDTVSEPDLISPVAIDLGVSVAIADSDGGLVENPRFGEKMAPKIAHLQRRAAKKQKGSKNQAKAKQKVAKAFRKLRRQREHFAHVHSYRYAKSHGLIVLEDLKLKNMTASARGTVDEPGKRVAQKSGLNRAVLDMGMGRFATFLAYKAPKYNSLVVKVPAAYSSQTCAECGHVDAKNRATRSRFKCLKCGHEDHADTNAAVVLLQRYTRRTGGDAACGGSPARGGPMKQETKTARSRAHAKRTWSKGRVDLAEDGLFEG